MSQSNPCCKDCSEIQDARNKNRTYCAKCKCIREKKRYAEKRKLAGKSTRRIGRNPTCICGVQKEHPNEGFCNKCHLKNRKLLQEFKKKYQVISNPNCSKCGKIKTGHNSYSSSWCHECINERKRIRRSEKIAAGLSWIGENRNTICNKCGKEKEKNYLNNSLCKLCRSEATREKRILARAKKGLRSWGSGNPNCSKCGDLKLGSCVKDSWCSGCRLEYKRKITAKKRELQGLGEWGSAQKKKWCCYCGNEKENRKLSYCYRCNSFLESEARFKRVSSLEGKLKERLKHKIRMEDPIKRLKRSAHLMVTGAICGGYLVKKPCEVCGKINGVDAHHDDYNKPLDVRWLCRLHHMQHHNAQKIKI